MAASPGILTHQDILDLCGLPPSGDKSEEGNAGPIRPCLRQNVRSASYDLRLGTDFHSSETSDSGAVSVSGMPVAKLAKGHDESIVIPPNDVVVVSSLEKLCLEDDLVAHLTLKHDILLQGLIMASQSQIDAGYEGWIFALLYNLTDEKVILKLGESILRLELVKLPEATKAPYGGDFKNAPLSEALIRPVGSSLQDLRRNVERRGKQVDEARASMEASLDKERRRISWTQWIGGIVAALLTVMGVVIPLATGFVGEVRDANDGVKALEREVGSGGQVFRLEHKTSLLEKRLTALECRLGRKASGTPSAGC
jgi:deoxycytidine triphosphate deaminase